MSSPRTRTREQEPGLGAPGGPRAELAGARGHAGLINWADLPMYRSHPFSRILAVWGRLVIALIALVVQAVLLVSALTWASDATSWVWGLCILLSVVAVLWIISSSMPTDYKLAWVIPIIALPLVGGVVYLLHGMAFRRTTRLRYEAIQERARQAEVDVPGVLDPEALDIPGAERVFHQVSYLSHVGPFLPFTRTATTYYPSGDEAFPAMLAAMEQAKRYILVEFFIVSEGRMWDAMFDVLSRKAAEGVDVRFMFDDLGSLWKLPVGFVRKLTAAGIRVEPFNRMGIGLTMRLNNRDHRKMLIIDGLVGFTGGLNIGDEYINKIVRFGHWKDTAVKLEGPGVWGLVVLFFTLFDMSTGKPTELSDFLPDYTGCTGEGLVVSYDDSPFDHLSVGWGAYRNLMFRAQHSVDIMTPYLIPSVGQIEVLGALARSGIRVRIVTPGIPDKRLVFAVTRSNYEALINDGVEVYEYTPGFMHAKQMVADDDLAIIGTINFDFRSFYLHQENAVLMYRTGAVATMREDFDAVVAQSHRVTPEEVRAVRWPTRVVRTVLRTFAPML